MALPNSQHFSSIAGSQNPSANQRPKRKTYAQAANPVHKVSLLHSHIVVPDIEDDNNIRTLQSRIFRSARTKGAFLLDISAVRSTHVEQQCMILLQQQHPNVHACLTLSDDTRRYLEIYIDKDQDTNDILNNGIIFKDLKLQIFPNLAMEDDAQLVRVKLSNLPLYNKKTVLEGLTKSLAIYGEIMDIDIITDATTGFFMGSGYAVLNKTQAGTDPATNKYQELSHLISWCESTTEIFRATWNNMPLWCRYCHQNNHTKFECTASKAKTLCYACHEQSHRSFECPRKLNAEKRNIQPKVLVPPTKKRIPTDRVSTPRKLDAKVEDKDYEAPSTTDDEDEEMLDVSLESDKEAITIPVDELIDLHVDQLDRKDLHDLQTALSVSTKAEVTAAIIHLQDTGVIAPVNDADIKNGQVKWKVLQPTDTATAFIHWCTKTHYSHLAQSTSITNPRPSQLRMGDYLGNYSN